MKFDIVTLFPEMFSGPLTESILKRAQEKGIITIKLHQLRDYAHDKHKTVDDKPCGGGAGMVLKVDVIDSAISNIKDQILKNKKSSRPKSNPNNKIRKILLAPSGQKFTQQKAIELSKYDNLILIAGHYEGFDQRIHQYLVDEEISIGDYVLTGGELPAMVMVDTISRMIPGVIKEESAMNESFMKEPAACSLPPAEIAKTANGRPQRGPYQSGRLTADSASYDFPVYTHPVEYKGWRVPEVLLSGDHKKIDDWRNKQQN